MQDRKKQEPVGLEPIALKTASIAVLRDHGLWSSAYWVSPWDLGQALAEQARVEVGPVTPRVPDSHERDTVEMLLGLHLARRGNGVRPETLDAVMEGWRRAFGAGAGKVDHHPRVSALALTFHSLGHATGIAPFNARELEFWARGPAGTSGSRAAAGFVLQVYNATTVWKLGPFNLVQAVQQWDRENLAAFKAWAQDPWWA